ncbi:FxDxF family PEP-CTERM protein [Methylobacillus methanolivorans]|uniref:FxDxF family PEP-CTERM protein n=1 Tax=Methylobacillus methanolivorans TaxID=1848927 RepID=A0ABW8GNF6_9PROT
MKFIKTFLASVALIVAASSANAATGNFQGVGANNATDIIITEGVNLYNVGVNDVGVFNHVFNFTLPSLSDTDVTLNNIFLAFPYAVVLDIKDAKFSLWNTSGELASANAGETFSLAALAAGSYSLKVTGTTAGNFGGSYSFAVNVTPVPEPSSAAMLLIGFAALGAVARRRKTL